MFKSFYLAGFECATGYNMRGEWIDQIAATEHDLHCDADYARLEEVGIHAVREAIRWPLVDRNGHYDFTSVEPFIAAANRHAFDVVWDLFHYGYPDDLDLFSDEFPARFAAYCKAAATFVRDRSAGTCYFTPVNEPSYFAWAAGEVARFAPHARGRGFELKTALARAAVCGIDAIRSACADARIVNIDPICRVVPADDSPAAVEHARRFNEEWVYEFWDMVSGRISPELGGSPEHLDIVGLNYYWTNQWELGREGVPLADDDPRRAPLADLVRTAWRRYETDVVITETSASGNARGPWIHELSTMAEQLLEEGVALRGICLYPILGMPEWHARDQWARMGLWDLETEQNTLEREACVPMLEALAHAQGKRLAANVMTERRLCLERTGNEPFVVHGCVVWECDSARRYSLKLVRCDRPYRLWVAALQFAENGQPVHRVFTAAELPMLVNALRPSCPPWRELLSARAAEDERLLWEEDMASLLRSSRQFENVKIAASTATPKTFGYVGGGRYRI